MKISLCISVLHRVFGNVWVCTFRHMLRVSGKPYQYQYKVSNSTEKKYNLKEVNI